MQIITSTDTVKRPTAIALGNFDGIHQGHRVVLQPILEEYNIAVGNIYPSVVSFKPHPKEFFTGEKIKLLTPITEKAEYLESLGFKQLVLLPFEENLARLTPQEFVEQILVEYLQAVHISVGEDFRFGYQRKGTALDLQNIANSFGIKVCINSLYQCQKNHHQSVRVSSSLIRQALATGEIQRANSMLGRSYTLVGKVVTGQKIGRTLGFPTANLELPSDKFLPRYGVYAVKVCWDKFATVGVMNIGSRPTVKGNNPSVEVHLLQWSGDLYNQNLTVSLEAFLRPEKKFSSLDSLKEQIALDCQTALNLF